MSLETTYYERNKETILNTAKEYYKNNRKVLSIDRTSKK